MPGRRPATSSETLGDRQMTDTPDYRQLLGTFDPFDPARPLHPALRRRGTSSTERTRRVPLPLRASVQQREGQALGATSGQ
jgi:hypothetical protein